MLTPAVVTQGEIDVASPSSPAAAPRLAAVTLGQIDVAPLSTSEAPALDVAEPITLARAKTHLRVVDPDEDDYIASLIVAARQMAEGRLNRTIVQRRRVARFSGWDRMPLLKPPVISVDSIGYADRAGDDQVLDPTQFYLPPTSDDEMPHVELYSGQVYPALNLRRNPITVSYTAGYPVGQVPAPIIQWMLLSIGTMYDNRATVVNGVLSVPLADEFAKWLLQPFMVYE